jgi:molybdopterin-containing oxidoreductase family membrane subunit
MATLLGIILVGALFYGDQCIHGFVVTNMTDQVSWGAYIANFTYLVGVAAAAVLLVVPSYIFHREDVHEVVLLGEILAFSAVVMCLMFISVDLGRPDRFYHILPFVGRINFPTSILAWDVLVITGYLLLNLYVPAYLLYKMYKREKPKWYLYLPFVMIAIVWAVSIHTVTAFLYSGFGSRPFWNSAILAPRFLIGAFVSGPAILYVVFLAINRFSEYHVKDSVFTYLRRVMTYVLPVNLFLFGCEIFTEFYTQSSEVSSSYYMLFGLHGHHKIVPYVWSAIVMEVAALVILLVPKLYSHLNLLVAACVFIAVGIWVEKGMGLIVPGFVPTPLGEVVEYSPSVAEFFVCAGVWAFGAALFTALARVATGILSGSITDDPVKPSTPATTPAESQRCETAAHA